MCLCNSVELLLSRRGGLGGAEKGGNEGGNQDVFT